MSTTGLTSGQEARHAPMLRSKTASTLASTSSAASLACQTQSSGRNRLATRTIAFTSAVLLSLCAGSIAVFSLYGHLFQERLHYSQFQVNGVATALSIATYLPVPVAGYFCDRIGPAPLSFLSALLLGSGYGLAAVLYRTEATGPVGATAYHTAYAAMILAFMCVGVGTCCMYLSAVATCAKNFGKGKHRGLALAVPIAGFGLSGMWEAQIGILVFYERLPDGKMGDVDVFRYFLFLAVLLSVVGLVGSLTLTIVDEDDLIEDAVEELERSGILDGSALSQPTRMQRHYGTLGSDQLAGVGAQEDSRLLGLSKGSEARMRKQWVLNAETQRFLTDPTMWCFALGFFCIIGPGEAFINNLGTVIKTLYPPTSAHAGSRTSAATHISIVGFTSTVTRLLTGLLTDLLAPTPQTQRVHVTSSAAVALKPKFALSRVIFLLTGATLLSLGLLTLGSGAIQNHGERFWLVSGLIGAGYGTVFSSTPILITVIWGLENFATNWGIVAMFPAPGASFWGMIYSAVYQAGAARSGNPGGDGDNIFCYGTPCYAPTFRAMTLSVWLACVVVLWAWKGRNGWAQKGIVV